ncbi:nucleotidyltransferase family protein [Salinibius halmophilus]|uniref:nucleotidyltransferase family protein n=1 Tax=Salinibius halmophilus TaxID=1853216 RepID=UPI0013146C37|nr:nucleotidyltransferase family protein [Salinibius halmophilus]
MNSDLTKQLCQAIQSVPEAMALLGLLQQLNLPNHYLAGGSVTQILWNQKLGLPALDKVNDFDVVYFDREHDSEAHFQQLIDAHKRFAMPVDVVNQANVHTWYGKKHGNNIAPHQTTEDGIRTWLPCFAVGVRLESVRLESSDELTVFAPYGLEDQANMIIRPNKRTMRKENYDAMNASFKARWPMVSVLDW